MSGKLTISLALAVGATLVFPASVSARPEMVTKMSRPLTILNAVSDPIAGHLNEWSYRAGLDRDRNNYGAALHFATCASRFNPDLGSNMLNHPVEDRTSLVRMVRQYRGCIAENGALSPVLLRAALAEVTLRSSGIGAAVTPASANRVGVPMTIEGFPLGNVSRCQVTHAPGDVQRLLSTDPGSSAEREAAQTLYSRVPQCGMTFGLGGIEPAVVRMSVIAAAYRPQ
jgi:hypothetical protein